MVINLKIKLNVVYAGRLQFPWENSYAIKKKAVACELGDPTWRNIHKERMILNIKNTSL